MTINIMLAALFFLNCGPAAAAEPEVREFPAQKLQRLEIYADSAEVTVRAAAGETLRLELFRNDPERCRITAGEDGAKFSLRAETVKKGRSGEEGRTCDASIVLHAPAALALNVESRMGAVAINGMTAEVSVDSRMGSVSVKGVTGKVKIRAGMGSVSGDACSPMLDVETSMGSVSLSGLCGPAAVSAKQGSVKLGWKKTHEAGAVDVSSKMGSVKLSFPASARLDLGLESKMGRVKNEFESVAGGARVSVKTGMGSITVKKD